MGLPEMITMQYFITEVIHHLSTRVFKLHVFTFPNICGEPSIILYHNIGFASVMSCREHMAPN